MMRHTIACLLALAASIYAQAFGLPDLSLLPSCAVKSATSGIQATGCGLTELLCICKSQAFLKALGTQLSSVCTPDEQKKTVDFGNTICEPLGIKIPYDNLDESGDESDDAAPSSAAAAEPSAEPAAGGEAPTESSAAPAEGGEEPASTYEAPVTGESGPPYPSGNGTNETTGANGSYVPFEGAATSVNVGFAGLAMWVLAVAGAAVV